MTSAYEEAWRDQAACLTVDPELFFPTADWMAPKAKDVCARCRVVEQCLNAAILNDERHGIWAGMDRTERNAARRKRKANA